MRRAASISGSQEFPARRPEGTTPRFHIRSGRHGLFAAAYPAIRFAMHIRHFRRRGPAGRYRTGSPRSRRTYRAAGESPTASRPDLRGHDPRPSRKTWGGYIMMYCHRPRAYDSFPLLFRLENHRLLFLPRRMARRHGSILPPHSTPSVPQPPSMTSPTGRMPLSIPINFSERQ